jgi:hypothetical protein
VKTTLFGETVVVAPQVRTFAPRRRGLALLLVGPLALLPIGLLVRQAWRTETALAAAGASGERVVAQELLPGDSLRIPLTNESEVVRIVGHAFGMTVPSEQAHPAMLEVVVEGRAPRREAIVLPLAPGRRRVVAEESELAVGDPAGTSIDVAGGGDGELTLTLRSVEAARGMLVRLLRRDAVTARDRDRRARQIDDQVWEPSSSDAPSAQRTAQLGFRWTTIAGVGGGAISHPLVLLPFHPDAHPTSMPLVWRSSLRRGERSAFVARRDTVVHVHADATLTAVVRSPSGDEQRLQRIGELTSEVLAGSSLEIESNEPALVTIRAPDPSALEENDVLVVWRTRRDCPIVVTAAAEPIVLRVGARMSLDRKTEGGTAVVRGVVGSKPFIQPLAVARSTLDRYEGIDPDAAPSEPSHFYVTIPAFETARLESDVDVDLVLDELDPKAPPRPIGHSVDEAPRAPIRGASSWLGFVPRRPSNAADVVSRRIRLGRVLLPLVTTPLPVTARVRRPRQLPTRTIDGRLFAFGSEIDLDVVDRNGEAVSVPLHVKGEAPVLVSVVRNVAGGKTEPFRRPGASEWLTVPSEIRGPDARAVIVIGDDLAPGPKKLRLTSTLPFALHAQWEHVPERPRWSSGDYEP